MTYDDMLRSLEIFTAYQPDRTRQILSVGAGKLFAGPEPSAVSVEHRSELHDLGWRHDRHRGCFWSWT